MVGNVPDKVESFFDKSEYISDFLPFSEKKIKKYFVLSLLFALLIFYYYFFSKGF